MPAIKGINPILEGYTEGSYHFQGLHTWSRVEAFVEDPWPL